MFYAHTHTEIRMDIYLCCALRAFHRREHRRDHVRERARTHPEEKCSKYTPEIPMRPYCISLCVLHFYQTRSRAGYLPSQRYTVRARSHRNTRSSGGSGSRSVALSGPAVRARTYGNRRRVAIYRPGPAGQRACVHAYARPARPRSAKRLSIKHRAHIISVHCVCMCVDTYY